MNIVYLLPVPSQPRYHKRINGLKGMGAGSRILSFERDYFSGKAIPEGYESLGRLEHGRYLKRMVPLIRALPKVRKAIKDADVVYAFGLDMLLLAWLAGINREKQKLVYEVGDIRGALLGAGFLSGCMRWLERFLMRRVDLLVVTSEAYVSGYFHGVLKLRDIEYLVIENKLGATAMPSRVSNPQLKKEGELHIGYFGVLRCRRSWEMLKELAIAGRGRIKIYLRGIPLGLDDLADEAGKIPNVYYGGPYVAPDDLSDIYHRVDIVWIAHHHGKSNLMWARANRFYEACFFGRPMVAQVGTVDGKVVEDRDLGACVDLMDIASGVDRVMGITAEQLLQWRKNIARLPKGVYMYTDEHRRLYERLNAGPSRKRKGI